MKSNSQDAEKILIRMCHKCGHVHASENEVQRCDKCGKSFLPLQYFEKIHLQKDAKFQELFSAASELEKEDLLKGLFVLW